VLNVPRPPRIKVCLVSLSNVTIPSTNGLEDPPVAGLIAGGYLHSPLNSLCQ
jgi:hypothetical protein